MSEVLKQRETRSYWSVVCSVSGDGHWRHHNGHYKTQEEGFKKLRWFRDAFLVSMVMTQCDGESPLPTQSPEPQPTGRPQLRLV